MLIEALDATLSNFEQRTIGVIFMLGLVAVAFAGTWRKYQIDIR
jgi:hypothetical protein